MLSQRSHESPHEVDPFAESNPFLGGESFENGDTSSVKGDSFSKINESTMEEMGGDRVDLDESIIKGDSRPEADGGKEEQSNLAKLLNKMKRNMEAEEAEKKQLKEKRENQKVKE